MRHPVHTLDGRPFRTVSIHRDEFHKTGVETIALCKTGRNLVKNLRSHDRGRTYCVIMETLRDELGYTVYDEVLDAVHYVPQHRERIFIVGFRQPRRFSFPMPPKRPLELEP